MLLRYINAVGAALTLVQGDAFRIAQKAVLHETPELTSFFFFKWVAGSMFHSQNNKLKKIKQNICWGKKETLHDYIKK